ncbi:MFS transporter [Candidatus Bathyarchaeota archaeon]|nr:MFS transporter [Candidatus Bathyarchaeota archaeon]
MSIGQLGATVALYGYNTFLPTIISALGYNELYTQLLTIPCYFAGVLCFLIMAYLSDRTGQRGYFSIAGGVTCALGYAIMLGTFSSGNAPQYFGCVVVAMGVYTATGIPLSWLPSNIPSHYKRAVAQAFAMALANVSGTFSPFLYRTEDRPLYRLGHAGCMGFVVLTVVMHALTAVLLKRENKKRDRGERDYRLVGKTSEEIARLGDNHPQYRYMY